VHRLRLRGLARLLDLVALLRQLMLQILCQVGDPLLGLVHRVPDLRLDVLGEVGQIGMGVLDDVLDMPFPFLPEVRELPRPLLDGGTDLVQQCMHLRVEVPQDLRDVGVEVGCGLLGGGLQLLLRLARRRLDGAFDLVGDLVDLRRCLRLGRLDVLVDL